MESVAHTAGLRPGDIVVQAGDAAAPTPAQVRRAFAAIPAGGALLVAIDRTGIHHVIALEKDASEQP
jgi:membrane-associated protease RseP (regulator of RpoE activity)